MKALETSPEDSLFSGKIEGLVLSCTQNERPHGGLLGEMDWRLCGFFSKLIQLGQLTGKEGECTYCPIDWHGRILHFITLGVGFSETSGQRRIPPAASLESLKKNLKTLAIPSIGLSYADFLGERTNRSLPAKLQSWDEVIWVP